jgi:hypothetical protein
MFNVSNQVFKIENFQYRGKSEMIMYYNLHHLHTFCYLLQCFPILVQGDLAISPHTLDTPLWDQGWGTLLYLNSSILRTSLLTFTFWDYIQGEETKVSKETKAIPLIPLIRVPLGLHLVRGAFALGMCYK